MLINIENRSLRWSSVKWLTPSTTKKGWRQGFNYRYEDFFLLETPTAAIIAWVKHSSKRLDEGRSSCCWSVLAIKMKARTVGGRGEKSLDRSYV